jgi:probable HAF family extracellular repeat protein
MRLTAFPRAFLRNPAAGFFLSGCFLVAAHPALAGPISITPLGLPITPPPYASVYSFATAVNNSGQVAGYTYENLPRQPFVSPFLYSGGVITNILGTLDPLAAQANGINNQGQIVGNDFAAFLISGGQTVYLDNVAAPPAGYYMATALAINDAGEIVGSLDQDPCPGPGPCQQHAYLYANGAVTDLSTLSGTLTPQVATAINNAGEVVGNGYDSAGNDAAFLYSNGTIIELGSLSSALPYSQAQGINNSGEIVGWSDDLGETDEPFLDDNGTFTDLGNLGGPANAYAINDLGQIVGTSSLSPSCGVTDADCTLDAFLYENGAMLDLNTLLPPDSGWQLTGALAINDEGQIAGYGQYNGETLGFLLDLGTPTPEPASAILLALGLALGLCRLKSRSR